MKSGIRTYLRILIILGLSFLGSRCVEPFQPDLESNDTGSLLVVEGLVTDQPGPFRIRLSSTIPVYDHWSVVDHYVPVSGALVQITDDAGNAYMLPETESGWYETEEKDLKGIPGNTYFLMVTTPEGLEYESDAVLMREVPGIDSVYHEERTYIYYDEDHPFEENKLDILVNTQAPGDDFTYFKWEFEETWEIEMPQYVMVSHGPGENVPPPSMEFIEIEEEERRHCWVTDHSVSILVRSTVDAPSGQIEGFVVQSIGPPDDRLNIRYSILVKQYVVERDLYNFFRKIRESNEETGGIYEKTPARVIGNIHCCNGEALALGYFMASAEKRKRIFIDPDEHHVRKGYAYSNCGWTTSLPYTWLEYKLYGTYNNGTTEVWSDSYYCVDCRARGTNIKPDFWDQ